MQKHFTDEGGVCPDAALDARFKRSQCLRIVSELEFREAEHCETRPGLFMFRGDEVRKGVARFREALRIEKEGSEMPPAFRPIGTKLCGAAEKKNCFGGLVGFESSLCAGRQLFEGLARRITLRLFLNVSLKRGGDYGAWLGLA